MDIFQGENGLFYASEPGLFIAGKTKSEVEQKIEHGRDVLAGKVQTVPSGHIVTTHDRTRNRCIIPTPEWQTPQQMKETITFLAIFLTETTAEGSA